VQRTRARQRFTRALVIITLSFGTFVLGAADRDTLRAQANQAFDAEMARAKAGDCPDSKATYDFNVCFGDAVGVADQNLKAYVGSIRNLLALRNRDQDAAEFDRTEGLWHSYMNEATKAAFHQFSGGTGGPSFEMETHLRLVRSHMTELNNIYGMLLRL